jgi:hypothetical protein
MRTVDSKKTILHLPKEEVRQWSFEVALNLGYLWMKEIAFRDSIHQFIASSLASLMVDRRRSAAHPHLKRASQLAEEECKLTLDILSFIQNMKEVFEGKRQTPFDEEMSQDEARSWLAEKRKALKQKIRRERKYRASVPYPDKNAATEEESKMQEEIAFFLNELLKTYAPKRVPRVKR